jgi:hypothetical protein
MKTILAIVALLLVVLACGCTAPAPQPGVANTAIPNVTGVWQGTADGYTTGDGFYHYTTTIFNVTTQKGQIFIGRKEYPRVDGRTYYENFTGIIGADGEFYEADSIGGFSIGTLTAPNTLELNYLEEGNDTKAIVIHLTRAN